MILKLPEPSTDFIVSFSDGVSFLTFERRQNQRKAHLYQISISQVITPCSMALMTTIYIASRMLINYAGSRTEARWVRVNKLYTLRLFWYAIINYSALDTRSTNGLG